MTAARDAILARVRSAVAGEAAHRPEPPAYRRAGEMARAEMEARFVDRLGDYHVHVTAIGAAEDIAAGVAARLGVLGISQLVIPTGLPVAWRPPGVAVVEEAGLSNLALNGVASALTSCALAIAETGTVVLDASPGQGRRAVTLLPDHHICVVFAHQLVETVPQALQKLHAAAKAGRPLTFFSGPSATADIEFDRVVGVHGPRKLDVVFVGGAPLP
ncbi:MAG: LutC/YkgG family protein [Caulobacteraceae bacterium]